MRPGDTDGKCPKLNDRNIGRFEPCLHPLRAKPTLSPVKYTRMFSITHVYAWVSGKGRSGEYPLLMDHIPERQPSACQACVNLHSKRRGGGNFVVRRMKSWNRNLDGGSKAIVHLIQTRIEKWAGNDTLHIQEQACIVALLNSGDICGLHRNSGYSIPIYPIV